jgi:superfamily II DNA or RNA helicase
VVITTPETCTAFDNPKASRLTRELSKVHWDMLIVDEAHKLKNYSSKLSTTLRDEYSYSNCVLLTGTPLQNSTEELWTLLNFVDTEAFQHHEDFAKEFGDLKESSQLEKLQKKLGPYLLRRQKENVEKSVPPKEEIIVEVELTVQQKQYYRAIYEQNKSFLFRGATKDGPRLTNLAMELRKCCNHPFLIRGAELELIKHYTADGAEKTHVDMMVESSGKLVLLDKLLPKLRADGHRVLIFSQFRIMLDILEDYLNLRYFSHERVDGAVTGKKRQAAIDKFSAPDSNIFVMLLSTRAGGVGINLTAADTVIIFDSDWNPQNDIQAQARAHRIGQTQPVKVYRLLTCKTYEMEMFRAASLKLGLDYAIMHSGEKKASGGALSTKELESLLKHGAYDIFREEKEGESEKSSTQFCEAGIDSILERSMVVMHGGDGKQKPTANFSKASFVAAGSDNLDVNDPDFWTKIVGLNVIDDVDDAPRKRKCTVNIGSYTEPDKVDQLFLMNSDSDFSDSGQPGAAKRARGSGTEKGRKKAPQEKVVPADWTPNNLNVLLAALVVHGYGNWEAIRIGSCLHYSLSDIAKGCRNLILFMFRVMGFASVGAEVAQLVGDQMESYKIMPGDPVDRYDSAVNLMSIINHNVVVKLAMLANAIQRNVDSLPEGSRDQSVLPFLPPVASGEHIEKMTMEALFMHPSAVPAQFHYIPHNAALWGSDTVVSTLQVLRTLPLPAEFTNYQEYLSNSKLRVGIASKLDLIQDQFTMFHAMEIEKYRSKLSSQKLSLPAPIAPAASGDQGSDDLAVDSADPSPDEQIRHNLPYPFPATTSSLREYLRDNLIVEDAPSDWWVTGPDDLLLVEGIVKVFEHYYFCRVV